jgi:hypothetical protein
MYSFTTTFRYCVHFNISSRPTPTYSCLPKLKPPHPLHHHRHTAASRINATKCVLHAWSLMPSNTCLVVCSPFCSRAQKDTSVHELHFNLALSLSWGVNLIPTLTLDKHWNRRKTMRLRGQHRHTSLGYALSLHQYIWDWGYPFRRRMCMEADGSEVQNEVIIPFRLGKPCIKILNCQLSNEP